MAHRTNRLLTALLILGCVFAFSTGLFAQAKTEKKLPEVEDITLTTKDGVKIRCSWFPGQKEKKSVPIIMAHGWEGSRKEFLAIAAFYQKQYGYAILVPDLRGHGDSNKTSNGTELKLDRFKKSDIVSSIQDLEACRKFLKEKNNKGELNLEMLTVIAAGEMAVNAIDWTILDWSYPEFNNKKQGQFVKAVVLLSPPKSFKGLTLTKSIRAPIISGRGANPISMMIAVGGEDEGQFRESKTIFSSIEKTREPVKLEGETDKERAAERWKKQSLYFVSYPTKSQSTALVSPDARTSLPNDIAKFIQFRVEENEGSFKWHEL